MFETLKQIGEIYGMVLIILMIISFCAFIFIVMFKWLHKQREINTSIYENELN